MDTAAYISQEVKAIMTLVAEIDPLMPDEDTIEVLIGAVTAWGTVEGQLLFSALEAAFDGAEALTQPARDRLTTLYALQSSIHDGEGADGPFNQLAEQYINGVKYHLAADVQEILPLAAQLPESISRELADSMTALKLDLV